MEEMFFFLSFLHRKSKFDCEMKAFIGVCWMFQAKDYKSIFQRKTVRAACSGERCKSHYFILFFKRTR